MAKRQVLITGMAGRIGRVITERIGDKYELTSLAVKPADGYSSHVADISDFDASRPAVEGQQTVVHLAADPREDAPWDSIHKNDIVGTYNVMEASRQAGVKRVVFASSNHVVGYLPMKDEPYLAYFEQRDADLPDPVPMITAEAHRPDGYYAVAKAFGESLGSYYWDAFGLSCIALRIGGVPDAARHPIHRFLRSQVNLVVGADDPGIFDSPLAAEIDWVVAHSGLDARGLAQRLGDPRRFRLGQQRPR